MTIKLCLNHDADMRGLHDVVCVLVLCEMTVHGTLLLPVIVAVSVPTVDHNGIEHVRNLYS